MYLKGHGMQNGQNFMDIYSVCPVVYVKCQNELGKNLICLDTQRALQYGMSDPMKLCNQLHEAQYLFVSKHLRLLQDLTHLRNTNRAAK